MKISRIKSLNGTIKVPGDKSISHRSIMLGALAKGTTKVSGFLLGADCLSTISCFKKMGIPIIMEDEVIKVTGKGLYGLSKPSTILDVGNSGTTMRLMSGILAGQEFQTTVTGDASIQKRPMKRIIDPLTLMGANIRSLSDNGLAPLVIQKSNLHGIHYQSSVASAQVKSAIILANLYTNDITLIDEPFTSRNHTEIMLNEFGGHIETEETRIISKPTKELYANNIIVPGDISSAAYFIAAGLITPHSEIILKDVGINETRDGIIEVFKNMNGNIEIDNIRFVNGEKIGNIIVKSSELHGTVVENPIIPRLIDEIPIIAVVAAFAEGKTVIKDSGELKVKESNRIDTIVNELKKLNINIEPTDDGMVIIGGNPIQGSLSLESYHDHRVAMSLAIAALNADFDSFINNSKCIQISYPNFFEDIKKLGRF